MRLFLREDLAKAEKPDFSHPATAAETSFGNPKYHFRGISSKYDPQSRAEEHRVKALEHRERYDELDKVKGEGKNTKLIGDHAGAAISHSEAEHALRFGKNEEDIMRTSRRAHDESRRVWRTDRKGSSLERSLFLHPDLIKAGMSMQDHESWRDHHGSKSKELLKDAAPDSDKEMVGYMHSWAQQKHIAAINAGKKAEGSSEAQRASKDAVNATAETVRVHGAYGRKGEGFQTKKSLEDFGKPMARRKGESSNEFMSRTVSHLVKDKGYDQKQAVAAAYRMTNHPKGKVNKSMRLYLDASLCKACKGAEEEKKGFPLGEGPKELGPEGKKTKVWTDRPKSDKKPAGSEEAHGLYLSPHGPKTMQEVAQKSLEGQLIRIV